MISARAQVTWSNVEVPSVSEPVAECRSETVSGVNLDEELANTITFQNAYSANARVITTVNKMYEDLLQAF